MRKYFVIILFILGAFIILFNRYKFYSDEIGRLKELNFPLIENEMNWALLSYFLTHNEYPKDYEALAKYLELNGLESGYDMSKDFNLELIKFIDADSMIYSVYDIGMFNKRTEVAVRIEDFGISNILKGDGILISGASKLDICENIRFICLDGEREASKIRTEIIRAKFTPLINDLIKNYYVGKEDFVESKKYLDEKKKSIYVVGNIKKGVVNLQFMCTSSFESEANLERLKEYLNSEMPNTNILDSITKIYFPIEIYESLLPKSVD